MSNTKTRNMVVVAMMSAVATVIYYLDFSVPLMPAFIKLDLSNVVSLIAGFSLGPVAGVSVCLVKDLIHLLIKGLGTTMGVGDIFDFVTGAAFTFTASLIYHRKRTFKSAVIANIVGTIVFTAIALPLNYFVTYPIYAKAFGGMEAVMGAYRAIMPGVGNLFSALCIFNTPFTFIKGLLCAIITMMLYKPLSPIIKGKHSQPAVG
jgi:riboflavin transporter FmnP